MGLVSFPGVAGASQCTTYLPIQESLPLAAPNWGWCYGDVRSMEIVGFGWSWPLGSELEAVLASEQPAVRCRAEVPGSIPLVLPRLEWSVWAERAEGSGKGRFSAQGRQSTLSLA